MGGMHRIAVLDFDGDQGTDVASALSEKLKQARFYTVTNRKQLEPTIRSAVHEEAEGVWSLLKPAREMGLDGVIVGEVVEYRFEDDAGKPASWSWFNNRGRRTVASQDGQSDESLRRGAVTIDYRLIDVETGSVRTSQSVTQRFAPNARASESEEEVLESLTQRCLDEIVAMLAPQQIALPMELARCDVWTPGRWEVRRGIQCAVHGDWAGAEAAWEEALEKSPRNHAALYNLAVIAARDARYAEAESLAMRAVRIEHCACYTKGLETIRASRNAQKESLKQREIQTAQQRELVSR